ncbi:hypothetical protein CYLTODRAFT_416113 [Cylindrobasidium torrendii FP15055 ss-10]|uniref:Uncharacterized protein n=1 Tax=Cylindrobasidium torrendii FP15055 ss-10 TaxID=1314674 RepID=A0A0D7BVK9_9AGAR|nr:hypothetical protein CYLTODRAFT_416113 [Cylindrobasidium torrendii FP15055 ss-10]
MLLLFYTFLHADSPEDSPSDETPRHDVATDYATKLLEVLRVNTALDPEGSQALASELAAQSPSAVSGKPIDVCISLSNVAQRKFLR